MASGTVVGEAGREQLVHGLAHHTLPLLWVAPEGSEAKLEVHALPKRVGLGCRERVHRGRPPDVEIEQRMLRRLRRLSVLRAVFRGPVDGRQQRVAHDLALKMWQRALLERRQRQLNLSLPPLLVVCPKIRRLVDHRVGPNVAFGLGWRLLRLLFDEILSHPLLPFILPLLFRAALLAPESLVYCGRHLFRLDFFVGGDKIVLGLARVEELRNVPRVLFQTFVKGSHRPALPVKLRRVTELFRVSRLALVVGLAICVYRRNRRMRAAILRTWNGLSLMVRLHRAA